MSETRWPGVRSSWEAQICGIMTIIINDRRVLWKEWATPTRQLALGRRRESFSDGFPERNSIQPLFSLTRLERFMIEVANVFITQGLWLCIADGRRKSTLKVRLYRARTRPVRFVVRTEGGKTAAVCLTAASHSAQCHEKTLTQTRFWLYVL